MGITSPTSPEILERARLFLEDGASYAEVGRTVGTDGTTLKKHLPGYGWPDYLAGKLREELKYIAQHAVANKVEVTALSKLSKTN